MTEFYYCKPRLYTPGPTPLIGTTDPLIYHRSPEFAHIFKRCRELLMPLFGSGEPPLILSCSGTGAMEACLVHLSSPQDRVLVVEGGKFGKRWSQLAESYGLKVERLGVRWGDSVSVDDIRQAMNTQELPQLLLLQASETSTGVYHPVEQIAAVAREMNPEIFIVVDGVSSVGAHPMKMDDWGIDGVISGSQKGFGIPPGLAFVALSPRAQQYHSSHPRFYFDLQRELAAQGRHQSAWTPAITLIQQLLTTLEFWHAQGLAQVYTQHYQASLAVRGALETMGLQLFAQHPSYALSSFRVPNGVNGFELLDHLKHCYGAVFAGGQEHLKGKIVRMAHLGFFDRLDLIAGLAALEMALKDLGYEFHSGLDYLTSHLCVTHSAE